MAFGRKTGGRVAGTPNRKTRDVGELLASLDCDPIRGMAEIARNPEASLELRGRMNAELAVIPFAAHVDQRPNAPLFECPPAAQADLAAEEDMMCNMRQAAERRKPPMIARARENVPQGQHGAMQCPGRQGFRCPRSRCRQAAAVAGNVCHTSCRIGLGNGSMFPSYGVHFPCVR